MTLSLALVPFAFALVALVIRSDRFRPWVVTTAGLVQLPLVAVAIRQPAPRGLDGWLLLDPLGKLVLGFVTLLFAVCALYVPGYLSQRRGGQ